MRIVSVFCPSRLPKSPGTQGQFPFNANFYFVHLYRKTTVVNAKERTCLMFERQNIVHQLISETQRHQSTQTLVNEHTVTRWETGTAR